MAKIAIESTPNYFNANLIQLPASKSISNRALIIQAFNPNIVLENLSEADDTQYLRQALFTNDGTDKYVGLAGTTLRFLMVFYALSPNRSVKLITEKGLFTRPIQPLIEALKSLGATIDSFNDSETCGYTIMGVKNTQRGITISASQTSQFISALLLCSPYCGIQEIEIQDNIVSKHFIELTLSMMSYFGVHSSWQGNKIHINVGQVYKSMPLRIDTDANANGYIQSLSAVVNNTSLFENNSIFYQPDSAFIQLANQLIAGQATEFNMANLPDSIMTMVCLAARLQKEIMITGTETLGNKESKRDEMLQLELTKLGYRVEIDSNYISLSIPKKLSEGSLILNSHSDHRLSMSFALLTNFPSKIYVDNYKNVSKSFPEFWQQLEIAGFTFEYKE